MEASDVMTEDVETVSPEDVVTVGPAAGIDRLAGLLTDEERDVNRLPVVEECRLVGIVTREDVLRGYRDR